VRWLRESNSTTRDVGVTNVVFVSLLNTGTLAQLNPSQSRSQEASVPECNSGGHAVLCPAVSRGAALREAAAPSLPRAAAVPAALAARALLRVAGGQGWLRGFWGAGKLPAGMDHRSMMTGQCGDLVAELAQRADSECSLRSAPRGPHAATSAAKNVAT